MTLEEALKLLLGEFSKDDASRKVVLTAIEAQARPLYQAIYNIGHGFATEAGKARTQELETQLSETRTALATETNARKTAEGKAPEVATVHEQYRVTIEDLKRQQKTALDKAIARADTLRRANVEKDLFTRLTSKEGGNFAPKYARVLAKQIVEERVKFKSPDDDAYDVMQAKLPNIPIAVSDGQDVLDVIVKEAVADPENEPFVMSKVDGGSGSRAAGTGGSSQQEPSVLRDFKKGKEEEDKQRAALNPLLPQSAMSTA